MSAKFYAVRRGRKTGIFRTWKGCKAQVQNFPYPVFKKFDTEEEAREFINMQPQPVKQKIECVGQPEVDNYKGQKSAVAGIGDQEIAYYAVHRGFNPGVYRTWAHCEKQVKNFPNALYCKFKSKEEAFEFVMNGKTVATQQEAQLVAKSEETVHVYTDGASSRNGQAGCTAGIGVYWGPDHPFNTSMRLPGRQTNNRAEIYAATYALRQAKLIDAKNVNLYTDSQFLINSMTTWLDAWKKNNWLTSSGKPVINKDDFIELEKAKEGINVQFIYVKAHDKVPGNIEADRLAVEGSKKDFEY